MIELNTISLLVYLCKWVLFGNDQLIGRVYEIFFVQYSTYYLHIVHENVYFVQGLLMIQNSRRAKGDFHFRFLIKIILIKKLTFVSLSRIKKSPSCPC